MNHTITAECIIDLLQKDGILAEVHGDFAAHTFTSITYNSRSCQAGSLFVCKGINFKSAYLADAISRGAAAYLGEKRLDESTPCLITTNIRRALALVAKAFYGYKKDDFSIIGVTGTKGKSTTVYYIVNALEKALGKRPAFLTTVDIFDGKDNYEATLTTPESMDSYAHFANMKQNGADTIVMELSSQADKMERLVGMHFKYGVFVNISEDHIAPDEHHDFDEYFTCKKNIVARFENAVINLDDERAGEVLEAAKHAGKILTYSIRQDSGADVYAKDITMDGFKTRFTAVTPTWEHPMEIVIPGVFNVSNALAACAIASLMGLEPGAVAEGIACTTVKGRMNIFEKNGYITIVDYAHNKDSIKNAFEALKTYYPTRKIKVLFGCPGCKAYTRRKDMSVMSVKYADYIYISSEDPSYKDPMEIAKEVEGYVLELGGRCEIITDRKEAIIKAIGELKEDELLFITGKGSEHYQLIDGVNVPYEGDTVLAETYMALK